MNEQWQRLQRNVGNIFIQTIGKVLPYLNAVLMVLNEIAKAIASLFGFKVGDFDYFDEMSVGVDDFSDSLDSATDSAKKLKQGLRGFDKLNVITTPSDTSSGASAGAGGINPKLMDAFNNAFDEYQKKLNDVEMKATKIRDKIMEWLGFTKQIDENTGEVSFKFDHITGGTVLGALAVGGSIYKGIKTILKIFEKIGLLKFTNFKDLTKIFGGGKIASGFSSLAETLGMSVGTFGLVAAAIVAIGAALIYAYNTSDEFKEKVDEMVSSVSNLFKDLYDVIVELLQETWQIIEPIWNDIKNIIEEVAKYCYENIVYNFTQITEVITGAAKIISDLIHGDFSGAFEDFKTMIKNLWDNWKKHFDKMLDKAKEFVPKLLEKFGELLNWFEDLPNKFFHFIGEAIGKLAKAIIETDWKELGHKILKGIIDGLINLIFLGAKAYEWVKETKDKLKEKIKNIDWGSVGKSILDAVINGMFNFEKKLKKWANSFVDGIKDGLGIHSPAKLILDAKIGDFSMDAIALGMEREMPILKQQAEDIIDTLNSGIKEATIDKSFNYDLPQFNANSILGSLQTTNDSKNNSFKTSVNPTIIIQVGNKEIAKQVITDLQDMAKNNGKPITIGG